MRYLVLMLFVAGCEPDNAQIITWHVKPSYTDGGPQSICELPPWQKLLFVSEDNHSTTLWTTDMDETYRPRDINSYRLSGDWTTYRIYREQR